MVQTAEPDVRNDIYSLGIIISQMQLGRGYRKIAERCLKPIHQRYQSVAELQADLRKAGNTQAATKKLALTQLILALLALAVVQTWRLQHAPEPVLIQPDLDSMRQQMSLQEQMSQERERQMNNSLGLLSDSLHRMASDNEQLQNQLHRVDDAKKTALHQLRKQMKASALDRHVDTLSRWDYRWPDLSRRISQVNRFVYDYTDNLAASFTTQERDQIRESMLNEWQS